MATRTALRNTPLSGAWIHVVPQFPAARHMTTSSNTISPKELRLKKLKWHSRTRGMKETNLLLGTYALQYADQMNDKELDQFEALLEENDPDLHNWILGSREAPEQYRHELLTKLQQHARNGLHNASLDVHIQTLS